MPRRHSGYHDPISAAKPSHSIAAAGTLRGVNRSTSRESFALASSQHGGNALNPLKTMVRTEGLEPSLPKETDFKSVVYPIYAKSGELEEHEFM